MQVLQTLPPHHVRDIIGTHAQKGITVVEKVINILKIPNTFFTQWLFGIEAPDLRSLSNLDLPDTLRLLCALGSGDTSKKLLTLQHPCYGGKIDFKCIVDGMYDPFRDNPHCQIRVLGLHNINLCTTAIPALTAVLDSLEQSLTGLAVSLKFWDKDAQCFV